MVSQLGDVFHPLDNERSLYEATYAFGLALGRAGGVRIVWGWPMAVFTAKQRVQGGNETSFWSNTRQNRASIY